MKLFSITKVIFIWFLLLNLPAIAQQTSWKGTTDTKWRTSSNWTNGVPDATTDAIIGDANFTGAFQPTLEQKKGVGECKDLTIGNGGTSVDFSLEDGISIFGDLLLGGNGTFTHTKGNMLLEGNFTNSGTYVTNGNKSSILLVGQSQTIGGSAVTAFEKLSIEPNSYVTLAQDIQIDDKLTVEGTIDPTANYAVSGAGKIELRSAGTLIVMASTFSGNYSHTGGLNFRSSSSVIDYASAAINQTIDPTLAYESLKISGGLTKSLIANTTIEQAVMVEGGILDIAIYTLDRSKIGGIFSVSSGATLKIGGTQSFPAKYSNIVLNSNSTVNYYGSNQVVIDENYGHLILSSSSGAVVKTMPINILYILGDFTTEALSGTLSFTAVNNIQVFGDIDLGVNTTFNGATFSHEVRGNLVNEGTYSGNSSTFISQGAASSWSGGGTFNLGTFSCLGSTTLDAASTFSVAGDFLIALGGSFIQTAGSSGSVAMTGTTKSLGGAGSAIFADLNIPSGASISVDVPITIAGNFVVDGSISDLSNEVTFTGSTKTISGTGTLQFYDLTVPGSIIISKDFSVKGDVSVTGSFTASAGTATFNGTSALSGTASLNDVSVSNGSSLSNSVNAILNIAGTDLLVGSGTFDGTSNTPNTVSYNGTGNQTINFSSFYHLTLANGATKTPAAALTINGNLTIAAATTFEGSTYTHTLKRDWINNGTFTEGTSTVLMSGTRAITVSGATTFNVLTINKSSNTIEVVLQADVNTPILNLTSGRILTGNNTITITNTRTGNGFIIGTVTRQHAFTTATDYAFEGPNNLINFSSITGTITAITVVIDNTTISSFPYRESINRTYDISVTGASAYIASLRLHYETGELNGNNKGSMSLWNDQGVTNWIEIGSSSNDIVDLWVEQTGLTSLEDKWSMSDGLKVLSWTGAVSSSTSDASNWTVLAGAPNNPPTAEDVAVFGDIAFTNQPNFNTSTTIERIIFESAKAANVTIGTGNAVTVKGNVLGDWTGGAMTHSISVGDATLALEGDLEMGDGVAGHTINVDATTGTLAISGSIFQKSNAQISFTGAGNLTIGNDYEYLSGNFTPGTSTVKYNGIASQDLAGLTYYNLTIDKSSGEVQTAADLQVSSNFTHTNGIFNLDNNLDVDGGFTIGATSTFNAGDNLISVAGAVTIDGSFNADESEVKYDGTVDQDVAAITYYDLTVNKTAGTASLVGNISIKDAANVINGTFDAGSYTISRTSAGGVATIAADGIVIFGGGSDQVQNFSSFVIDPASTVHFNGTTARYIPPVTYGNLIISNGAANAKSLIGATSVVGDLTINSGATFSIDNYILSLEGDLSVAGTMSTASSFLELNGNSKEISGSLTFDDVIVNGSYDYISGNPVFNGSLEVSSTGDFDLGASTVELYNDFTNSGVATSTGTVTFMGTQIQVIRLLNAISSSSSGVVNFNGTVAPILSSTSSPQFATVNINNTDSIIPSASWTVAISMNVASGATFVGGNLTHNFLGYFNNSGVVTSSGVLNFTSIYFPTIINLGNAFTSDGTVAFGGNQPITLIDSAPNFAIVNITNSHASGINPGSGWTIDDILNISSGAIFNAGSYSHTISGSFLNEGTFNGESSSLTFDGVNFTISGNNGANFNNLIFDTGSELEIIDGFTVLGNFTNNATILNLDNASIEFSGSNQSIIAGTSPLFNELTINKSSNNVRLDTDITVSNILTMTDGSLSLNSRVLNISNVLSSAISRTSGVILSESTNNSGKVSWTINTDLGTHIIPFGSSDNTYIPFTFELSSGDAGIVSVSTYQSASDNTPYPTGVTDMDYELMDNSSNVVDRFFQVDLAGETSPVADMTLSATAVEVGSLTDLVGQRWSGTEWEAPLVSQISSTLSVTIPDVSQFSPWIMSGSSGPLPVELLSFEVKASDYKVILKWETASETNNDGFIIQRSNDGSNFEDLEFVLGAGDSRERLSYQYIDGSPIDGQGFYRLKQVDLDGQFEYSKIKMIQMEKEVLRRIYLYPNPLVGNILTVKTEGFYLGKVNLSIMQMNGNVVYENDFEVSNETSAIDIEIGDEIKSGVYLVNFKSATATVQEKLVIVEK